jgi:hypothetical protein
MAGEHSGNCEVSGGTSGIGKATALAFAAAGAKVVSTGRCEKEGTHELLIRKRSTASWAKNASCGTGYNRCILWVDSVPAKKSRLLSFTLLPTQRSLPPARHCRSSQKGFHRATSQDASTNRATDTSFCSLSRYLRPHGCEILFPPHGIHRRTVFLLR